MIVINPVNVTSSSLTSSSIPEPDASKGEVEWSSTANHLSVSHVSLFATAGDGFLWIMNGPFVYQYNKDFTYTGNSFTTGGQVGTVGGIAFINGLIYVADDGTGQIYAYTQSGLNLGASGFSVAAQSINYQYMTQANNEFNIVDFPNVYVYDSNGSYISTWIIPASVLSISGISYDNGSFYVCDDTSDSVVSITDGYVYISSFSTATETLAPTSIMAFDDRIFVGDGVIAEFYGYAVDGGGFYSAGEEVIKSSNHKIYIANMFTNDDPEIGVLKDIPTWTYKQPTSKYAMFDEVINTQSLNDLTQIIEITPGAIVGGLAGINITGASAINVTMTDPIDGVVYNKDIDLIDNTNIVNWFNYLWDPFTLKEEFVLLDLPPYSAATTKVTITGAGEIGVGALVLGPTVTIGTTEYDGTTVQNLDFSIWQEDAFGNLEIIKRPDAKLVNYGVFFEESNLNYVTSQLDSLRGLAAVYVGAAGDVFDYTLVYGRKRESEIDIQPQICKVPVQVRGLT